MRHRFLSGAALVLVAGLLGWPGRGQGQRPEAPPGLAAGPARPAQAGDAPVPPKEPEPILVTVSGKPAVIAVGRPAEPGDRAPAAPVKASEPPPALRADDLIDLPRTPTGTARVPAPRSGVRQAIFRPEDEGSPTPGANADATSLSATGTGGGRQVAAPSPVGEPGGPTPPPPPSPAGEPSSPPAPTPQPAPSAQAAVLSVEVSGAAQVAPGQSWPCTVVVRNVGTLEASQVRVEQVLPAGVRLLLAEPSPERQGDRLTWGLANLEAGGERRLQLELQALETGEVVLAPTATFTAAGLRAHAVRPPFSLLATGPETVTAGGPVSFRLQVANYGEAPLQNIVVHVQLPAGLQHPAGDQIEADIDVLPPGEVKTIDLEATAARAGRLVTEVSARAAGGLKAQARAVVVVKEAVLALRLKGLRQGLLNQDLDFRLEVENPGAAPANHLRLTQHIPGGLDFAGASTGGTYDPAHRQVVWDLATLAGGQKQRVTFKLKPRLAGDWALRAVVEAEGMAEVPATAAIHLEGAPALALEVVAHDDPIEMGADTVYEMRVLNQGTAPSTDVRLVAWVPEAMVPLQQTEGPTAARVEQQRIVFEPLSPLSPREEVVYRVHVRGAQPGAGRFRVEMTAPSLSRPVLEEVSAHVRAREAPQP